MTAYYKVMRPDMPVYYKATRPDGTDFKTGRVRYDVGATVHHPISRRFEHMRPNEPETYLSTSVELGEVLLGGRWPCRLFRVEPVGNVVARTDGQYPYKRGCVSMVVAEELPPHLAFGPQGEQVAALFERLGALTALECARLAAAWDAAWDAAEDAKRNAADAAWDAKRHAAWAAAWDAAWATPWYAIRTAVRAAVRAAAAALVVRDVLAPEHFDVLYEPWASVIGDDRG